MDAEVKKLIIEAMDAIKRGDTEDALLVLERVVRPKFRSSYQAREHLARHDRIRYQVAL